MAHAPIHIGAVYIYGCQHQKPRFRWGVGPIQKKGQSMPVEVTMSTEEMVLLSAWPETAAGSPDDVDGEVEFEVIAGDCTLGERVDGLRMWVLAGTVGDSVVRARGDADLGDGVMHIEDVANVHVFDPVATVLRLTADAPTLKV